MKQDLFSFGWIAAESEEFILNFSRRKTSWPPHDLAPDPHIQGKKTKQDERKNEAATALRGRPSVSNVIAFDDKSLKKSIKLDAKDDYVDDGWKEEETADANQHIVDPKQVVAWAVQTCNADRCDVGGY